MWEIGNIWADSRSGTNPMASYHSTMHEIHVLLVDHDSEALFHTAKLLEICQYRVTLVELASAAISMLISGKAKFDAVIASLNSPDLHGYKLLQQSVRMGLPTVVTSNEENTYMAMRSLESGAFLFVKKPITMEMLKCLWQHVLRERMRMGRERDQVINHGSSRGVDLIDQRSPENLESMMMTTKKSKKKQRGRDVDDINGEYDHHRSKNSNVKKKMCTEWTQELHAKFLNAVEELGEGRCFPKDILDLMNVPGLTRMQVASHLQKCRNDNWRSPLERKTTQQPTTQPASSDPDGPVHRPRRFGSKPQLGKTRAGQSQESDGPGGGQVYETQTEAEKSNNVVAPRNMEIAPPTSFSNTLTSHHHHHHYGPNNAPHGANANHMRYSSSDHNGLFGFQEADCVIKNHSYHFAPSYHVQNSAGPSMESKSQWSSDTSNFESDQSDSRDNE